MPGSNPIQSVSRTLDILELLAPAGGAGLSLQELAARLGLKPPTVHNFLRTLQARDWLERLEKPVRYRLGPGLTRLATSQRQDFFLDQVRAAMRQLATAFPRATVIFAEAVQQEVLVRLRLSAERPGAIEEPIHRALHPYGCASPLLFQALWNSEDLGAFRQAHPFWENGGGEIWKSVEKLECFLEQARQRGQVLLEMPGESRLTLAVAVADAGQALRGALGASMPAPGLPPAQRRKFIAAVTEQARQMSKADQ